MRGSLGFGAATVAFFLMAGSAQAASLTVYPVRVVLTAKEPVQTMKVQNAGAEATRIQLRVFSWRQENGKDVFEETRDVLANPGLFEVGIKGEQLARFGLRTTPGTIEKSYRVFLEEIPGSASGKPGEVRTLLRISIPIFVPAPDAKSQLTWRLEAKGDQDMMLEIRNTGSAHIQISRLAVSRQGGKEVGATDVSVYVLPGATRRVPFHANTSIRAGEPLKINATTDQENLVATLVSEALPNEAGRP